MSSTGQGGFQGLAPTVGVIRRKPKPLQSAGDSLEQRVRTLLLGHTIVDVKYETYALTLHLSSGEVFVMRNQEGFAEG